MLCFVTGNDVTGQLIVILKVVTKTLWIMFPALLAWVLSCWQTVFLRHLAYLFIHLTFTVAEADGLSLGYKFLTPRGFTASITTICWAELLRLHKFNQWHMNTIKAEVLKAKSFFNGVISMRILCSCVQFMAFCLMCMKSQMVRFYNIQRIYMCEFTMKSCI